CDLASFSTYVEPDGRLVHHFRFRLVNWHRGDVPVLLPADVQVLAARTEGRWLPSLPVQAREDGSEVILPASMAAPEQSFDLYFATPGEISSWALWQE